MTVPTPFPAVPRGTMQALVQDATMSADAVAMQPHLTHAEATRAIVRRAIEALAANGRITVVPIEQWPDAYVIDPPYDSPLNRIGTLAEDHDPENKIPEPPAASATAPSVILPHLSTTINGSTIEFPSVRMEQFYAEPEYPDASLPFWFVPQGATRVTLTPLPDENGTLYRLIVGTPENKIPEQP